ncbi:hypothetical protein [Arthrobacter pigmenti]
MISGGKSLHGRDDGVDDMPTIILKYCDWCTPAINHAEAPKP